MEHEIKTKYGIIHIKSKKEKLICFKKTNFYRPETQNFIDFLNDTKTQNELFKT